MQSSYFSVLVTGGAGFIGSHLAEALVRQGLKVTIVDDLSNGALENIQAIRSQVNFVRLDIRSPEFRAFLTDCTFQAIFHFAANAYVPPSVKNPDFDFGLNLVAPFQLLEALRCFGQRPAIIFASSAAVYGNPVNIPMHETDPAFPISPYGVSKLATERYAAVYALLYEFRTAAVRLFSVYGPRQKKQIVFDFFKKLTANPHELEIYGDGTQVRDMVYVDDVVAAVLHVWRQSPLQGQVYNVATGIGHSTNDIAVSVSNSLGLVPHFRFTGSVRPGDSERWIADVSRLEALGFRPQITLDEGVRRTMDWFVSQPDLALQVPVHQDDGKDQRA